MSLNSVTKYWNGTEWEYIELFNGKLTRYSEAAWQRHKAEIEAINNSFNKDMKEAEIRGVKICPDTGKRTEYIIKKRGAEYKP
jgi:hypothetical protein